MVDTSSSSTLRFCVERFAPRRKHSIDSSNNRRNHSSTSSPSSPSKSPTRTSHRKKSLSIHHSQLFGKFVNCVPSYPQASTITVFILHNKAVLEA